MRKLLHRFFIVIVIAVSIFVVQCNAKEVSGSVSANECEYQPLSNGAKELLDFNSFLTIWVCTVSVLILVISRSSEVNYGFKLGTIIRYAVPLIWRWGLGLGYFLLLPVGFYLYYAQKIGFFMLIWFFTYIFMAVFLAAVLYFGRRKNIRKIIVEKSVDIADKKLNIEKEILDSTQLPLVNLIHHMDMDFAFEKNELMKGIVELCKKALKGDILLSYTVLMGLINEVIEVSGVDSRYEAARTINFLTELLEAVPSLVAEGAEKDVEAQLKKRVAIRAGMILPLIDWTVKDKNYKSFACLMDTVYGRERDYLVLLTLMYIEYLACCGDKDSRRIKIAAQMELSDTLSQQDFLQNPETEEWLAGFWYSWEIYNHQSYFMHEAFEAFYQGCVSWRDRVLTLESYVFRQLMKEGVYYEPDFTTDFI